MFSVLNRSASHTEDNSVKLSDLFCLHFAKSVYSKTNTPPETKFFSCRVGPVFRTDFVCKNAKGLSYKLSPFLNMEDDLPSASSHFNLSTLGKIFSRRHLKYVI